MPRSARLDVPGVLQHVMARGIDGYDIFQDERDREAFLERLAAVVEWARAELLAWCLMSNHFHLLMRPRGELLAPIMRRLMTGYAVWHNRRHRRRGHLFQNRYKSIVVEEDPYFLELVRYIHLNPVRAGLVETMQALDRYPYTGHAVIVGRREYPCQNVDEVLGCSAGGCGGPGRGTGSSWRQGSGRGSGRSCRVVGWSGAPGVGRTCCGESGRSGSSGTSGFWGAGSLCGRCSIGRGRRRAGRRGTWERRGRDPGRGVPGARGGGGSGAGTNAPPDGGAGPG